jgi:hypothetical protein
MMHRRLLITEEEKNSIRKMQLLEQVSPDPEIVETLKDMGFEKQFCKGAKANPSGIELSHEYCSKAKPQVLVSYPKPYTSIEVLDLINQKIIEIIDSPTPDKLENTMKGYFASY